MKGQENVQVVQPNTVVVNTQDEINISDYLIANIFACLFCCCCIGIAAIVKSNECQKAKRVGDVEAARRYSASAKNLLIATIVVGIIVWVLNVMRVVFVSQQSSGYDK